MFLTEPMRRVNILLDQSDAEGVAIALARLEQVHLDEAPGEEKGKETSRWDELNRKYTERIKRSEELLETLHLECPVPGPFHNVAPHEDLLSDLDEILEAAEQSVQEWEQQVEEAENEIRDLRNMEREVRLLEHLDAPLQEIRRPDYLHWAVGVMPRENMEALKFALFKTPEEFRRHHDRSSKRVNIFVDESEVEKVAAVLTRLTHFEFSKPSGENTSRQALPWGDLAKTYTDQKQRLESVLDKLDIDQPEVTPPDTLDLRKDRTEIAEGLEAAESAAGNWQRRKDDLEQKCARLEDLQQLLHLLEPLDTPIDKIRNAQRLHIVVGRMPAENMDNLQVALYRIPAVVLPISRSEERVLVFAATTADQADLFDNALYSVSLDPLDLPENIGPHPVDALQWVERQIQAAGEARDRLHGKRNQMKVRWQGRLSTLWRQAAHNASAAQAIATFDRREGLYLIKGRVPAAEMDETARTLEQATRGRAEIEVLADDAGEKRRPVEVMFLRIPVVIVSVDADADRLLIVAVTNRDNADVLDRALRGTFMDPLPLPEQLTGLPSEVLPRIRHRLKEAEQKREDLNTRHGHLANRWGKRLCNLHRQALIGRRVADAVARFSRRGDTTVISGWVPAAAADGLTDRVNEATAGRTIVELVEPAIDGRQHPPTRMRNLRLFRPFEALVRTFGFPRYGEIDPTPLTAVTFTLMYGLMFGDVGHGLMLAAIGLAAARFSHGMIRQLSAVLTASGLSGAIFGLLYGSIFGLEGVIPKLWLSPLHGTIEIMMVSVVAGIVLLSLGFLAAIANHLRSRNWGELFFGHQGMAGLGLYWALIGGGYAAAQGRLSVSTAIALVLVPASVLFLHKPLSRLITGKRPLLEEGPALFVTQSFFELFEKTISDASNSLSFVRLGAFAVAHAVFMKVIFSLGQDSGFFARWLILVVGTIIVVGFEGLVVGIQAMRLEYYEFYSRFFEGRGFPFKPLKLFDAEES